MIVVGFILFAILIFAWLAAPGGEPARKRESVQSPPDAPAHGAAAEAPARA